MKRILAAMDDSAIATSVLAEAWKLAQATGAEVLLLRIVEPQAPRVFEPAGESRARMAAAEADEVRKRLERVGVNRDLHCVRLHEMDGLIGALPAHAAREERGLYRWMASANRAAVDRAA